ncbi:MAG: hypothetical protein LBU28_01590 [Spirochaetaceae bacterium]|jgi:hypothetical protein|nr:hypothetical protein [Spirochaetaceae bacterium]
MNARFRSPEDWKSALMILPDSSYFDLIKSVFGNIKTPFNKQRLLEDLSAFLSRKDIQDAIGAYIGPEDHRIIAAVAVLEEPAPGEVESFFSGELSYGEVHSRIINLEERLILYRIKVEGVYRLALNPVLAPVLAPFAEDPSPIFPSEEAGEPAEEGRRQPPVALDTPRLAALTAFVLERPDFFKSRGGIRKKVLAEGRNLFPGMEPELALGALTAAGLFHYEGEGLFPHEGRLRAFAALSPAERREYTAAGLLIYLRGTESGYFQRNRLQSAVRFVHHFLAALEPGRRYPRLTLKRIGDLLERGKSEDPPGGDRPEVIVPVALEKTGLLERRLPGFWSRGAELPDEAAGDRPVIALDTAFSCILYPEIGLADALTLAYFSSVRETGTAVRFEIQRESAVRGFDRNIGADAMIELLERLSGKQADTSLVWSLRDWERRYSGAALYRGVVLTLSEDRRYLAEAEPVASLVAQTLGEGVYLLSAEDTAEAAGALQKAGLDIVARRDRPAPGGDGLKSPESPQSPYPSLAVLGFSVPEPFMAAGERSCPAPETAGEGYKERFRGVLETLRISKADRDELAARIERRLILDETQLTGASIRAEKLEARGLDYVGKNAVAKQALASKSLVEVIWPGTGDEPNRALGIPQALEKRDGETVLVLKPMPQGEEFSLPLGRISLLRRIKQSIFEA